MSFLDYRQYPAIAPLVDRLVQHHARLRDEAVAGLDQFMPSPERYIMEEVGLYVLPARWQGERVTQVLPGAGSATRLLGELTDAPAVANAIYSMSIPGCEIVPHIDGDHAIGEVYRVHVGLDCPAGDCALIVDGERREWRTGEAFMFDSARVEHSAHNRTSRCRMIAIVDFYRALAG